MKTITSLLFAATLAVATTGSALADSEHKGMDHSKMGHGAMLADASEGVVRKIDMAQGKVTLRHGPIKNLDMPPMTMVFTVKDKAMLEAVKAGDKVKFKAADVDGRMTVTEMMPAN
jgi:Cu/Ag efflux protein CusF